MIRKAISSAILAASAAIVLSAQTRIVPSQLTLEEKVHLLSCDMGVERLGVPQSFYSEGMHGIAYGGPSNWGAWRPLPTTSFPQGYGLGQTWDPELLTRVATQESIEQRYYFQNPKYDRAGLVMWAPNVDLGRDPRWGRTQECYGEDPWLISKMAVGFIRGAQGPDPDHWRSAALMKHFLANSYEYGRYYSSSDISERQLREYYGYTFWKGVTEGGCRGVMTAYNAVNGIPMTVHPVIRSLMVEEWGNDGIICTDQDAMRRLVDVYGAYEDYAHAAAEGIKMGVTQFLSDEKEDSQGAIWQALARGLVTEADLDDAIQRNLNVLEKLGLLGGDDPYAGIGRDGSEKPCLDHAAHQLCREVTGKSVVLLKNDGILPLKLDGVKKVALIGPYADVVKQDWYGGTPPYQISILRGLHEAIGDNVEILCETADFAGAGVALAKEADIAIVVVGDNPTPCLDVAGGGAEIGWGTSQVVSDGMEEVDRQSLTLSQEDIVKMVMKANPNTVMVLMSGFPYAIRWSQDHVPAIIHVTHGSQELGHGVADVLLGKLNPAGRLSQTWPESIEDLPDLSDYDITKGRTYMYSKAKPLYPFGFGLSYTSFRYSGLKVEELQDGGFEVSVDVSNTGDRDGEEVVQLYVQYPDSKVLRPERQLRGFKRVGISKGETVTVTMQVSSEDLSYWDESVHAWKLEAGKVNFLVGASSSDIRLKTVRKIR